MRERQKHVSSLENRHTHQSSSTSLDISELLPIDILFDILSRLPYKTIAKCRCVSKLWSSILSRPDFIDLFLKISAAHPRLLFTFFSYSSMSWHFFSLPQPIKPDENLPLLAIKDPMSFLTRKVSFYNNSPVHGLFCSNDQEGRSNDFEIEVMVYNPTTGQSMALPKVKKTHSLSVKTFLGYDPINRQSKVILCISASDDLWRLEEYQVLTLTKEELSWRKIECSLPAHYMMHGAGICINGILYYIACLRFGVRDLRFPKPYMIVCFDVMSEKFTFIDLALDMDVTMFSVLINYNGKLGITCQDLISRATTSLELWILDGVNKEHKWIKMIYVLPLWNNIVADHTRLSIVGMTGNGEFVFSPMVFSDPFYVFFYNLKTNTIKRVEVQGIGPVRGNNIYTFINHVEDMRWMSFNVAE